MGAIRKAPCPCGPVNAASAIVSTLLQITALKARIHFRSPFRPSPCPVRPRWLRLALGFPPSFAPGYPRGSHARGRRGQEAEHSPGIQLDFLAEFTLLYPFAAIVSA